MLGVRRGYRYVIAHIININDISITNESSKTAFVTYRLKLVTLIC